MKVWEVIAQKPDNAIAEAFYVMTVSAPHAREWGNRRGLRVTSVREVAEGEVPVGAEFHRFSLRPPPPTAEDSLAAISQSPLIVSPVWTIALGVLVGALMSGCLASMIGYVLGGGVRIGP